jgi:hypothetical protein
MAWIGSTKKEDFGDAIQNNVKERILHDEEARPNDVSRAGTSFQF